MDSVERWVRNSKLLKLFVTIGLRKNVNTEPKSETGNEKRARRGEADVASKPLGRAVQMRKEMLQLSPSHTNQNKTREEKTDKTFEKITLEKEVTFEKTFTTYDKGWRRSPQTLPSKKRAI